MQATPSIGRSQQPSGRSASSGPRGSELEVVQVCFPSMKLESLHAAMVRYR